jgi:hypothetical protein
MMDRGIIEETLSRLDPRQVFEDLNADVILLYYEALRVDLGLQLPRETETAIFS